MNAQDVFNSLLCSLYTQGAVSIPHESKALGVNEDTIRACLEPLVFCFDTAGIRMEFEHEYARLISKKEDKNLRLDEREISALIDALQKFGIESDDELVQKLIATRSYCQDITEILQYPVSTTSPSPKLNFVRDISLACDNPSRYLLEILYKSENDTKPHARLVEAHSLVSFDGKGYVRCFLHENGEQRQFKLSRIQRVTLIEHKHPAHEWALENRPLCKALVAFEKDAEIPNWPNMKLNKQLEDGRSVYELPWFGNKWLPKQIISMLGKAQPIDPPELVSTTKSLIDEYLGKH